MFNGFPKCICFDKKCQLNDSTELQKE